MKTVAGRDSKGTGTGTARRTNRGVALGAPGHGMPAVAQRISSGDIGAAIGAAPRANNTGLPDRLKTGIETLSGLGMDDVRVHYDSPRPPRLQALAYAQGTDIHLGPGQEKHLPHEAWHVVQQKQGRVPATLQMKGIAINDDGGLEREADLNGTRAAAWSDTDAATAAPCESGAGATSSAPVVQRKIGFEFETGIPVRSKDVFGSGYSRLDYQEPVFTAATGNWKIVADSSNMEFVTNPFNENAAGRVELGNTMTALAAWAGVMPARVAAANAAGRPGTARVDSVGPALGTTGSVNLGLSPLVIKKDNLTDAEITAAPQATGGVRLDQIETLVTNMTTTQIAAAAPQVLGQNLQTASGYTDAQLDNAVAIGTITAAKRAEIAGIRDSLRAYQAAANVTPQNFATSLVGMNIDDAATLFDAKARAVHAVDGARGMLPNPRPTFDKLKGFMTLVLSYILVGHRQTEIYPYSKIIAPLMARTNFYTMYRLLDANEKAVFTENFVLTAAGLAGTGGTPLFAQGFRNEGQTNRGPTRAAWIDSIIQGSPGKAFGRNPTDLMSQGSGSVAAANSAGLGSMAQADQRLTGQRDLAVLELRRLPKQVQRLEWRQMALTIFDMIVALP